MWAGAKLWLTPSEFAVAGSEPASVPSNQKGESTVTVDFSSAPQGILGGGSGVLTAQRPVVAGASSAPDAKSIAGLRSLGQGRYALDTLGAVCPFPLIEAKDAMKHLDSGEELVINFDCTQATDAIPRWASVDGHEVTNFEATGDAGWTISVKKG